MAHVLLNQISEQLRSCHYLSDSSNNATYGDLCWFRILRTMKKLNSLETPAFPWIRTILEPLFGLSSLLVTEFSSRSQIADIMQEQRKNFEQVSNEFCSIDCTKNQEVLVNEYYFRVSLERVIFWHVMAYWGSGELANH